jgi:3-phenylpropionate/cinnamic acid dioxygenase small subunit
MSQSELNNRLVEFVYHENRLLDDRQFEQWYDLFADDGIYWIPTQPGQTDRHMQASIALEDKMLLKLRIARLSHPQAHSLQPRVSSMHVVQRPEVDAREAGGGLPGLTSNIVYLEHQGRDQIVLGARVRYMLRETEGQLRIVEKKVELLNMDGFLPSIQLFI